MITYKLQAFSVAVAGTTVRLSMSWDKCIAIRGGGLRRKWAPKSAPVSDHTPKKLACRCDETKSEVQKSEEIFIAKKSRDKKCEMQLPSDVLLDA